MSRIQRWAIAVAACAAVLAAACGDSDEQTQAAAQQQPAAAQQPAEQAEQQQAQPAQQAQQTEQVQQTRAEPEPVLQLVVSSGVIGDWASQVAGDLAEVRVLTPPGADVHTLDLSVEDVRAISAADLTVMNGAGLEASWQSLVEENAGRVLWLVEALEEAGWELAPFSGLAHGDDEHDEHEDEHGHEDEDEHGHDEDEEDHDEHEHEEDEDHGEEDGHDQDGEEHHEDEEGEDHEEHEDEDEHGHDQDGEEHDEHEHEEDEDHEEEDGHGHGHGHAHGSEDPHFWFDLELASAAVRVIAAELIALRPDEADAISERMEAYLEEMEAADREAAALLAGLTAGERLVVTFHDAFGYFARRYGLTVAGFVVEGPEQDVGAGQIAELIDLIDREGVARIYREPQYESTLVNSIADQTGAEVGLIYPQPAGEVRTWMDLVLTNARAIAGR